MDHEYYQEIKDDEAAAYRDAWIDSLRVGSIVRFENDDPSGDGPEMYEARVLGHVRYMCPIKGRERGALRVAVVQGSYGGDLGPLAEGEEITVPYDLARRPEEAP